MPYPYVDRTALIMNFGEFVLDKAGEDISTKFILEIPGVTMLSESIRYLELMLGSKSSLLLWRMCYANVGVFRLGDRPIRSCRLMKW
jgi:hypothetical protein